MNIGGQLAGRMIMQALNAIKSRASQFSSGISNLVRNLTRVDNSRDKPSQSKEWKRATFPNGVGYANIEHLHMRSPFLSSSETNKKIQFSEFLTRVNSNPELKNKFSSVA
ncbi:hypothetical protein KC222_16855 [Cedecea davisae]|uniref:Uncharacterized protein n=1 Tax=Cedecea davisae TaxID=158484 RepID=A0ABS6DKD1_9ENTR|nr:hypothetical protein [Cedecea davisae]MBU4683679.1 hypothetical protein [Cedecea davisae]MBU4685429.1 hypothetical protein [Cedecea davisae]